MARIVLNSANTAVLIGSSPAFKEVDETASLFAGVQTASFSLPQSRQTQMQVGSCYYAVDDLVRHPDIDLQIDYSFSPTMSNETLMGLDVMQENNLVFSNPGNRNLVAWWDSSTREIVDDEEGRSTWLDLTENELHLSQIGDVVSDSDGGVNGNYFYFESGISDGWGHLEIDGQNCKQLAIPGAQTYSAWINPSDSATNIARFICSKSEADNRRGMLFYIEANSNNLRGMIYEEGYYNGTNPEDLLWGTALGGGVLNNEWTHVAMVFDPDVVDQNDKMQFYINGEKRSVYYQYPEGIAGVTSCYVDDTVPFKIGKWNTTDTRQFDGKIDEVAVFNKALTKEEIVWLSMNNYYEDVGKSIFSKLKDKSYNFYFYNHPNQNFDAVKYLKNISTNSPNNGEIISFGNAYLMNYSVSFADGSLPVVSTTFKCSNMKAETYNPNNPTKGNLVAWWDMSNGGNAKWLDRSPRKLHLDQVGTVAQSATNGVNGVCANFNGDGWLYIDNDKAPELGISGSQTYSSWVYLDPNSPASSQIIIGRYNNIPGEKNFNFYISSNRALTAYITASGIRDEPNQDEFMNISTNINFFPEGEWHHVAMVYEPSQRFELWMDGKLAVEEDSFVLPKASVSDAPLRIGKWFDDDLTYTSSILHGKIDEVSVFDRALEPEEIAWLYNYPSYEYLTNNTSSIKSPAINLLYGNNIGVGDLDVSETKTTSENFYGSGLNIDLADPVLQRPGDFILNLQDLQIGGQSIDGSDHMIKTMSINLPVNRVDLQGLGSSYNRGRKIQYPSKGTLQISSLVSKYETGFISGLLNNESTYEFSVKARSCDNEIECDFNFYDLKLETFNYSVNVNEEMQYNAGFSFYVGKE